MGRPLKTSSLKESAQLVQRRPSHRRNDLGLRNTESQFSLILETVLVALIASPEVFYRLTSLHRGRLLQQTASICTLLEDVVRALSDARRASVAVDTAPLKAAIDAAARASALSPGIDMLETQAFEDLSSSTFSLAQGLAANTPRGRDGETGRRSAEALADLRVSLGSLEQELPVLRQGLDYLLAAEGAYSVSRLRGRVSPLYAARMKALLEQMLEDGDLEASSQTNLLSTLSVRSTVRLLKEARHPTDPLIRGTSPVLPVGSALRARPTRLLAEATAVGTQQPGALADTDTLVYGTAGEDRTIQFYGAASYRMVSEVLTEPVSVTKPYLLLNVNGTLEAIKLTPGSRTLASLITEIGAGFSGTVVEQFGRLYLLHSVPFSTLTSSTQAVQAGDTTAGSSYPLALSGTSLTVDVSLTTPPALVSRAHVFSAGVYNTPADVKADLDGDAAFMTGLECEVVGGELVLRTTTAQVNYILQVDTGSTAAVAGLSFSGDVSYGNQVILETAATELGYLASSEAIQGYTTRQTVQLVADAEAYSSYSAPVTPDTVIVDVDTREEALTLTSSEGDSLSVTAPVSLGVSSGLYFPQYDQIDILGTLRGELRERVVPADVLGIVEGCRIDLTGLSVTVESAGDAGIQVTPFFSDGTDLDILQALSAGTTEYRQLIRKTAKAARAPHLVNYELVLSKVTEAARTTSLKTLAAAAKAAASLLNELNQASPNAGLVQRDLQLMGVTPVVPAGDLVSALDYSPLTGASTNKLTEAILTMCEESGFSRLSSLLLEGRYLDVAALEKAGSSSASRMMTALSNSMAVLGLSQVGMTNKVKLTRRGAESPNPSDRNRTLRRSR